MPDRRPPRVQFGSEAARMPTACTTPSGVVQAVGAWVPDAPAASMSAAGPPVCFGVRVCGQAAEPAVAGRRAASRSSCASASVSTAGGEPGSGLRALSDISRTAMPPITAAAIM